MPRRPTQCNEPDSKGIPCGRMTRGRRCRLHGLKSRTPNSQLAEKLGHCIHQYVNGEFCQKPHRVGRSGYCSAHEARKREGRDMDAPWPRRQRCGEGLGPYMRGCRCQKCTDYKEQYHDLPYRQRNRDIILQKQKIYRENNSAKIAIGKKRCYERKRGRYLTVAKAYRDDHPELLRGQRKTYYERNAPAIRAAARERRAKNRERDRQRVADYQERTRDIRNRQQRDRYQNDPEYRARANAAARKNAEKLKNFPSPRSRLPWTKSEDTVLLNEEISEKEKAALTGRSPSAVRARIFVLRHTGSRLDD